MQTEAPVRKTGRLTREDQRRLGDILQRVYDDVVRQGVPDRFKDLLEQLDSPREPSAAEVRAPRENEDREDHSSEDTSDRIGGHGLETSGGKGSH